MTPADRRWATDRNEPVALTPMLDRSKYLCDRCSFYARNVRVAFCTERPRVEGGCQGLMD